MQRGQLYLQIFSKYKKIRIRVITVCFFVIGIDFVSLLRAWVLCFDVLGSWVRNDKFPQGNSPDDQSMDAMGWHANLSSERGDLGGKFGQFQTLNDLGNELFNHGSLWHTSPGCPSHGPQLQST